MNLPTCSPGKNSPPRPPQRTPPSDALIGRPHQPLGTAEEIAQAVLWLNSPAVGYVVRVALPVGGGYVAR